MSSVVDNTENVLNKALQVTVTVTLHQSVILQKSVTLH